MDLKIAITRAATCYNYGGFECTVSKVKYRVSVINFVTVDLLCIAVTLKA